MTRAIARFAWALVRRLRPSWWIERRTLRRWERLMGRGTYAAVRAERERLRREKGKVPRWDDERGWVLETITGGRSDA